MAHRPRAGRVSLVSEICLMLRCNMNDALTLRLGLEDLLADLHHARKGGDMGRLALIAYCEVRRWARLAGEPDVAQRSSAMITVSPHASKQAFLAEIDELIRELEQLQPKFVAPAAKRNAGGAGQAHGSGAAPG
jgi:hypothetical protein